MKKVELLQLVDQLSGTPVGHEYEMAVFKAGRELIRQATELAALKGQKPVGEAVKNYGCGGSTFVRFSRELGIGEKVYLAAGAQERKPLLASEIVTMYAEQPTCDAGMIEFAREIELAHGIKDKS